jgi:hypothetical protein
VRAARRAGRPVSAPAKGHTRPKLAARLVDLDGKRAGAVPSLDKVLAAGRRRYRDDERVVLPEHYATDMAESLFEDAELSRGGRPTTLFDEVRGAIEQVVPGAFGRDAVAWDWLEDRLDGSRRRRSVDALFGVNGYGREGLAWNWLSDNLAGTRWRGHIDAMLGPEGFGTRLPVRVRPGVGSSGVEWVDVRIRARFTGGPIRVGRTDAVVMLIQDYAYEQGGFGRSAGRTVGGGGAGDAEVLGQGVSRNMGTDRSRGSSGDAGEQVTTLRGLGAFDGADRIQHGITFEITVERTAALPGLLPAGLRRLPAAAEPLAGEPKTARPVTVSGTMVRLVPDGLATAADAKGGASPPAGAVTTARPFRMPQQVRVDARGNTTLGARLRTALADPRLLGPLGVHENRGELHNAISPVALSVFLPRMVGADGHFVGRFPVPGKPTQFVEVWVRAALFEEDVVVAGRENIEIRTVFREQGTAGAGETTGQLRPVSRGGGFTPADLGLNVGTSHGEQGSHRVAGSGGLRRESTLYEKGTVSTVRVRADYELVLRRVRVIDGAVRRARHEVRIPGGSGITYVTLFNADHRAPYTGVRFDRSVPTEAHVARRSGAAWPVALWSRGPGVQSGGGGYGSVGVGGGPIAERGYTPEETRLMRGALEAMWRADVARRAGVPVRNRGPPEAGLRADEELFVPRVSEVVEQLRRDGLPRERAEDLARRLVEFSWRDEATGTGVIVVPEHRLAQLRRAGLLGDAVEHARRFHLDPNARHDQRAHDADARRVVARLGGPSAAVRQVLAGVGGSGHAAAFGGITDEVRAAFLELLPELHEEAFLAERPLPYGEGPRLVLIDNDFAWSVLTGQLLDLPGRLLGFGWRHPLYAPERVIVMFAETYGDLRDLTRAGVLSPSWWQRFADHESVPEELFAALGIDHAADEAALVDDLPLAAKIKLSLGSGRAATVAELAGRFGVTEAEVRAAAQRWERLAVSPDGVVVARPPGHRVELRVPVTDSEQTWRSLRAGAKRSANQELLHLPGELAEAQRAGVAPLRIGTPEAMELLAEGGMLKWTLRADGTLWISRPFGALPNGKLVEITHAVIGGGQDALAAGEIFLLPGLLEAAGINVHSGHYMSGNSPADNVRARALGRAAFARYGIQVKFDFVLRDEVEPNENDHRPGRTASGTSPPHG